jgi:LPS-assembly protein
MLPVNITFHFKNYAESEVQADVHATLYSLDDTTRVEFDDEGNREETELEDSANRAIPGLTYRLGTTVEKVFEANEGNLIKTLGELGPIGRTQELKRLKHTIEPRIKYRYVPEVDQDDIPSFDSLDRLIKRNLLNLSLVQRLFARYEPRDPYLYGVEELAPEVSDIETIRSTAPLDPTLDYGPGDNVGEFQRLRVGAIKELVTFKLSETYDIEKAIEEDAEGTDDDTDNDGDDDDDEDERGPWSDLAADLTLYPNDYVALRLNTDFDVENNDFSMYGFEGQLADKRGDQVRARFNFIEDEVRQLDSNLEVRLTENTKVGFFTRYDALESEFIERRAALRFYSTCRCWMFDLAASDRTNPDQTKVYFMVTLTGLGEFGTTLWSRMNQSE